MLISYILLCKCCFYIVRKLFFLQLQQLCCSSHSRFSHNLSICKLLLSVLDGRSSPSSDCSSDSMHRCAWPSRHVDRDDVLCGISMVSSVHNRGAVPRLQPDSVSLHRPDLPEPHRSHSACPLRAWHWYDREHGYAGCCIFMYDSAERGARLAERHLFRYIPAALPGEEGYYTGLYS